MSARYHTHVGGTHRAPLWWVVFLLLAMLPVLPTRAAQDPRNARVVVASPENTVVVTTASDHLDADANISSFTALNSQPGADSAISLREALLAANNTPTTTLELAINFSIPITDTGYSYDITADRDIWTIQVGFEDNSLLPPLSRGHVRIDGTTQLPSSGSGSSIVIDGILAWDPVAFNGLTITSPNNVVRGLAITNFFDNGIAISGTAAANNTVAGCYIGIDSLGQIGDQSGNGISLTDGAHANLIGGSAEADRNLISGNEGEAGVLIAGATTTNNTVAGNWIGLDVTGLAALPNQWAGVQISGGAHDNTIGGATLNVISSNNSSGVLIRDATTTSNTVANNWIGLDTTGQAILTGTDAGIIIDDAQRNLIGRPGQGNLIAGNDAGIDILGGIGNRVSGNTLGLALDGTTRLGNRDAGIYIRGGARDNIIGGTTAGAGNVIAGNAAWYTGLGYGIYIYGSNTTNNTVQGNYIGVDAGGNRAAGHRREGVLINGGAYANTIGGVAEGAGNVISNNGLGGISLWTTYNLVAGNLIGLGADGQTPLGNQSNGIRIWENATNNVIGPNNEIAASRLSGIRLSGGYTTIISNTITDNRRSGICTSGRNTTIISNTINHNGGTDGEFPECNYQGGVVITNTVEASVLSNTIHDNIGAGITVNGGSENRILSNSISGNTGGGIVLLEGANGNISAPTIRLASSSKVSGTSCPLCHVQIFTDDGDQGLNFVTATTALANGSFSIPVTPGMLAGPHVTATNTDPNGNTSRFAPPKPVSDDPDPPPQYKILLPLLRMR